MLKPTAFTVGLMTLTATAFAQAPGETQENMASAAEAASVGETLAKIGCTAEAVEKESANLFEVDDATCEIGQYDIKLDATYNIISMTRDE